MTKRFFAFTAIAAISIASTFAFQNCANNGASTTTASSGALTPVALISSRFVANGAYTDAPALIDGNPATTASSAIFPGGNGSSAGIGVRVTVSGAAQIVRAIRLYPKMINGQVTAFPARYQIFLSDASGTTMTSIGIFEDQPGALGYAEIQPTTPTATMIMDLSVFDGGALDENGQSTAQFAEIQLLR